MQVEEIYEAIGESLVESIQAELIRIGLSDSNIIKSVTYKIQDNQISVYMPDYYKYIESGRRPLAKRVPIEILIKWMKRKNIAAGRENKAAWAIQRAIYLHGIKPRPFLNRALNEVQSEVEELLALDFSTILDEKIKEIING